MYWCMSVHVCTLASCNATSNTSGQRECARARPWCRHRARETRPRQVDVAS
ncbi:hypothetical protein PF005_g31353 [Phytophthora fragariae]|uniref:Uncharacterized protein n=1 Tax=Phytophthora fragariae TaxID=53985 RepID=A0A6A3PKU9_9STRA|nr:hypothetical protein PF003_g24324 [Phytophthora fragariae]KAE8918262.1 hypothetical protein PF009_g31421 [Phytophthora fragariae]KAE8960550.1 hypothetical protein PF011_g30054 [Phytophthora fragariae]KAE9062573.1 hypothetical protein PF006_g31142 [Phytophthora fragariae]KAE9064587.1 hypothetical protein PF007_g29146 [Phytophthora fragariae]